MRAIFLICGMQTELPPDCVPLMAWLEQNGVESYPYRINGVFRLLSFNITLERIVMKRILFLSVILCMCLTCGAAFGAHGHYVDGVEGINAGTAPPEGFYWRMYNLYYTASQMKDNKGETPGDFKAHVYAMANRFIYSTPIEILGGNLVVDAIVPLVYTDLYYKVGDNKIMDANRFGVGDILVEPFVLSWHGERWDALAGVGVYMPSGGFRDPRSDFLRHAADPGKGFWTFMGTLGGTVYMDAEKTWSASALARYEIHTEQSYTGTTPGNDFHLEWGVGKTFDKIFTTGAAGYCNWQTTRDTGNLANRDQRERGYAIGPEIGFVRPDWKFQVSLRSLFEFKNRNAPQGITTALVLTKAF